VPEQRKLYVAVPLERLYGVEPRASTPFKVVGGAWKTDEVTHRSLGRMLLS